MAEEEKEETERLRKEIEQKGREIQELKKKVEELRAQISQGEVQRTPEVEKLLEDASELLDAGFGIFGISGKTRERGSEGRGLFALIGDLAKLAEESKNVRKTIDIGGKKGVIDFSVRTGPLVRPSTRPRTSFVGTRRVTVTRERVKPPVQPSTALGERREPLFDVFDEGDSVKLIAELPGVEKNDINLELADGLLKIKVDTPTRKYYEEVKLPSEVEKETVESTYRNGILEVKLKKRA